MTASKAQIEDVVRQVLAEFGLLPAGGVAPSGSTSSAETPNTETSNAAKTSELAVAGRVVALADVAGRLDGVRRLVAPRGAVVTPSVRDELYRKGVTLTFGQPETAKTGKAIKLILMVSGSTFDAATFRDSLSAEAVEVDTRRTDCLIRAGDELAGELARGKTLAVLTTGHPAAAVCLANRHREVRAVQGLDAEQMAADAASVGANLLVVDPGKLGPFLLKRMVMRFWGSGPATCPKVFQDR